MRFLRRLFAAPTGAAPAPLPELAPPADTAAWHMRAAHRSVVSARVGYGRRVVGSPTMSAGEIVAQARLAATHLELFALRLENEAAADDVVIPDTPDELLGGGC